MSDPIEHVGADQSGARAEPVAAPKKPGSHSKIAHLRPKVNYEKAQAETADARAELQAASSALRTAEKMEGSALADWIKLNPAPSADEVTRQFLAGQQATRAARVEQGLDPDTRAVPVISKSPIDQFAAARGKAASRGGTPLRSNVVRR
ncbi:MAG: hypothetical protein JWO19_6124 [Bryobacterales bacterium]|nr:hypothetical protein [Bryobacterales bacterium]